MARLRRRITSRREAMLALVIICVFAFTGVCFCDTFTNQQTNEVFHGYATGRTEGGQTSIYTQEKGAMKLNLSEWQITRDKSGRNNKVIVLPIDDIIMYEMETTAFEQAIAADANEGPLLILVEIDTPGGRIDLAHRICAAITKIKNCDVIAFIKGGQYGGAISAGAAVALACDRIYVANNTVIGAATLVSGEKNKAQLKDKNYEDVIDEKQSSAWRAYLASLAQQNNRPGLVARAMVDRTIEVIEVNQAGKRMFIEPVNKKPEQQVVRTWNKSGSLLTLTAQEAVECSIADGLADTQQELLQKLQAGDANVVVDKKTANARKELQLAQRKVDEILKSFDLKLKQTQYSQPTPKFLSILRGARSDFETLKDLAKKYPDLNLNIASIEAELNSINAAYENAQRESRSRK